VADPAVRTALLDTAARIVATDGPAALSLRRLAGEVGTSTMAIYTHFGGMDEVRREVRREGFVRLDEYMAAVEESGDPVADLGVLGWAYISNAFDNPNLYRAMFLEGPVDPEDLDTGLDTFVRLISAVDRCVAAGRFRRVVSAQSALQLWALNHGLISLYFAHLLTRDGVEDTMGATAADLFVAFGDKPEAIARSRLKTRQRAAKLRGQSWRRREQPAL
jgi:AcrR family transcriptional regulator